MKRWIKLLIVGALSSLLCQVSAEEQRYGSFIYVPGAEVSAEAGTYRLMVEGIQIEEEGEVRTAPLSDAEFGVYVLSSEGDLVPWANPLFPLEPMRFRSGMEPVHFSLPAGLDYYLRQESAPAGYVYDPAQLIPVTSPDVVVRNDAEGEIVVSVGDSLGNPFAGATFSLLHGAEIVAEQQSDASGLVRFAVSSSGEYTLMEKSLPEGALPLSSITVDGVEMGAIQATFQAHTAQRTEVRFTHPSVGTVDLRMQLALLGDDGLTHTRALPDVVMDIEGQGALRTDALGKAEALLTEGTYRAHFHYEGQERLLLPVETGELVVQSGATTLIELTATQQTGRLSVSFDPPAVASYTLTRRDTQETYGPFAADAYGEALSMDLPQGSYAISFDIPEGFALGKLSRDTTVLPAGSDPEIEIRPGEFTQLSASLLTMETAAFAVEIQRSGADGAAHHEPMERPLSATLEGDGTVQEVTLHDAHVTVSALGGTYRLRLSEEDAKRLGVLARSEAFSLPAGPEASIAFLEAQGRLRLQPVDEQGGVLWGEYAIHDAQGNTTTLSLNDEDAVTVLLAPGMATIETVAAADGYAPTTLTAEVISGETHPVIIAHERYALVRLDARRQALDAEANPILYPAEAEIIVQAMAGDTPQGEALRLSAAQAADGIRLPKGRYRAQLAGDTLRAGEPVFFETENGQELDVQLVGYDALGGVRLQLIDEDLDASEKTAMRFQLLGKDAPAELRYASGAFVASDLPEGTYVLHHAQTPSGLVRAADRTILVQGGETTLVRMSFKEYASLSVSKSGLAFDRQMRSYLVPLTGTYRVYTREDGELKPYPNAETPLVLWANAAQSPEKLTRLTLPASAEGTTYYLQEASSADGFQPDTELHEIVLHAGEDLRPAFSVASDRGFFSLRQIDAQSGAPLMGGLYALVDASGEQVLTFSPEGEVYQNEVSLPVGEYTLRQLRAPEGYALGDPAEQAFELSAYLPGDPQTELTFAALPIPQDTRLAMDAALWQDESQGISLLFADPGNLPEGLRLIAPAYELRVQSEGRTSIQSVTLGKASDSAGNAYSARIEYALRDGGWRPSEARMLTSQQMNQALSLQDVRGDIVAVRVRYLLEQTGEEIARGGFAPGTVALHVRSERPGEQVSLQTEFSGVMVYRASLEASAIPAPLSALEQSSFTLRGGDPFETESGGEDGRISGIAFLDENSNGVLDPQEKGRYAGMGVRLLDAQNETVEQVRTASDGSYRFDQLPMGSYRLQFEGGDGVVYSSNTIHSQHVASAVSSGHGGQTERMTIDSEHSDYLAHAGCMPAAVLVGRLVNGEEERAEGMGGLNVELYRADDDEPSVSISDDDGRYGFYGLLPGAYELRLSVPEGYLSRAASDGVLSIPVQLLQGEERTVPDEALVQSASIAGTVQMEGEGIEGAVVDLLSIENGNAEQIEQRVTDATGLYAFEALFPGEYSVRFTLPEGYAFGAYGEDSQVYGAAGRIGSTRVISLLSGGEVTEIHAGVTIPASLSLSAFEDHGADGIWGPYDEPLMGLELQLIRQEAGEDAEAISATTDQEGMVSFEGLTPGTYVLVYTMPGAWRTTKPGSSQTARVNQWPQTAEKTDRSAPFVLLPGEAREVVLGAMLSGSILGTAFDDGNGNGVREDESGLEGLKVELMDAEGVQIGATQTDEQGAYAFEGLSAGRYTLRFTAPEGYGFTASERGGRAGIQQTTEAIATTRELTVASGTALQDVNASLVRLASLSGLVWVDSDGDGMPASSEMGEAGVQIDLMTGDGRSILQTTQSDAQGRYAFAPLLPGNYKLRIQAPEGRTFSLSTEGKARLETQRGATGYSGRFEIAAGEALADANYGVLTQGSLSGRIWQDVNYNGLMEEEEAGLRAARVALLDAQGAETMAVKTDRDGAFSFEALMPGEYALCVDLPEGYVFTKQEAESIALRSDEARSIVNLGMLSMGEDRKGLTVGALRPASLSGQIWLDADSDGRMRFAEAGLAEIPVTLTVLDGADEGLVRETHTDSTGAYRFEGVMPGRVALHYALGDGQAFGIQSVSSDKLSLATPADAREATALPLDLVSGEVRDGLDLPVVGVGGIQGRVTHEDQTADLTGLEVHLLSSEGQMLKTCQTDAQGSYRFDFVRQGTYQVRIHLPEDLLFAPGMAFGVTEERDQTTERFALAMGESRTGLDAHVLTSAGLSGKILVEGSQYGMPGATVSLLEGGTLVRSAQTGADGRYAMDRLRPGTYRLRVSLDAQSLFARETWLNLVAPDALEGETPTFTLASADALEANTIYAVWGAALTGQIWQDSNADGRMDAIEPMLPGTQVELLTEAGETRSVVVDESGKYAFDRLRAGRYTLKFTLPDGYLLADALEEAGGSIVQPTENHIAQSEPFALSMGERREGLNVGGIRPGLIGDTVWLDENGNGLQDYREQLLPGVALRLTKETEDGKLLLELTTESDAYGYYRFDNLRPGRYRLHLIPKEGDVLTQYVGEPLTEIDSNLDPTSMKSGVLFVQSGQQLRSVDVGLLEHNQ